MAEVWRRALAGYANTRVEEASFEDWVPEPHAFGLLFSAQAWHWVAPDVRYRKAHEVLSSDGAIALFWNRPGWGDSDVGRTVEAVYDRLAPGIAPLGPARLDSMTRAVFANELVDSGLFHDVSVRGYPWAQAYRTDEFIRLLGTHSDHRMLPDDVRNQLLAEVAQVLDDHGGEITLHYVSQLYLARPV